MCYPVDEVQEMKIVSVYFLIAVLHVQDKLDELRLLRVKVKDTLEQAT
jgi:hypothetical protein